MFQFDMFYDISDTYTLLPFGNQLLEGMMVLSAIDAFLKGYKPAYLAPHMYEQQDIDRLKEMGYPSFFINHDYGGSTMFFADEDLRRQYIAKLEGIEIGSREEMVVTGLALGYPPKAVEFFAEYMGINGESLEEKKAGFTYYGIRFVANIEDSEEISEWLWAHVPAPQKTVEVEYQGKIQYIEPSVVLT